MTGPKAPVHCRVRHLFLNPVSKEIHCDYITSEYIPSDHMRENRTVLTHGLFFSNSCDVTKNITRTLPREA